ncbi:stage II sporulation protein E domain protein [Leptospira santarosai str. CBC1416]|uniref:Stage II sporulation protein E domain protein n=1 Tax=Leptospira santarosai str. CBC1416 TaxID=1193059 RepID=M6VGN4_9LEPT|nr:stage II sporulation protein E domain protein [Leptospira santarosai str. CBC1416]
MDRTGSLLGLDSNNRYGVFKFNYQYGDRLFLLTDGIYEEFNSDKQQFGELAVQDILSKKFSEPMEETIPAILQSLIEHLGSTKNTRRYYGHFDSFGFSRSLKCFLGFQRRFEKNGTDDTIIFVKGSRSYL